MKAHWPSLAALALSACISRAPLPSPPEPPPLAIGQAPFAFSVMPAALKPEAAQLEAELQGQDVLGLFTLSSRYDLQPVLKPGDASPFGQQTLAQEAHTSLPLPLGSPLQLGVSSRLQQRLSPDGLLADQQRALAARWQDGALQLALDARDDSEAGAAGCALDASLSADALQLGGQLCQRTLRGGLPQKAQIVSAQTGWHDAFGARSLRLRRVVVQNLDAGGAALADFEPVGGLELGAQHVFQRSGWSLSQHITVRSDDRRAQPARWAARSQLSRRVRRIPVTASWQRHDLGIWSLDPPQATGTESSLGFDLSAPLQRWLTPGAGADLSYRRLDPADRKAAADEQIQLRFSLGW